MDWELVCNDIMDWSKTYNGPKFHAVLTDCPYEYGFQGKSWDDTGISFQKDTWEAIAMHLHPGAFCATFAGARTAHRIAVAIEDAGLIIHPHIYVWLYGSGIMKSTRIDTQIDKAAGAEREVVGESKSTYGYQKTGRRWTKTHYITRASTPMAKAWEGHRYSLQVLRPAAEPVILFQKPYSGKPVDSIVETGSGAIWIDGIRYSEKSRWPTNFVVLCTCDSGTDSHEPECPVSQLGNKSEYFQNLDYEYEEIEGDRFIEYAAKSSQAERNAGLDDVYWKKDATSLTGYTRITIDEWEQLPDAERAEGNMHNTVKPISLTRWLATMMLPPAEYKPRRILVPFAGVMSESIGAMLAGWDSVTAVEIEEVHCDIGAKRMMWWQGWSDGTGKTEPTDIVKVSKSKFVQMSLME
jgi:site-specific DNA-methyltransferase (adenine-specific)